SDAEGPPAGRTARPGSRSPWLPIRHVLRTTRSPSCRSTSPISSCPSGSKQADGVTSRTPLAGRRPPVGATGSIPSLAHLGERPSFSSGAFTCLATLYSHRNASEQCLLVNRLAQVANDALVQNKGAHAVIRVGRDQDRRNGNA